MTLLTHEPKCRDLVYSVSPCRDLWSMYLCTSLEIIRFISNNAAKIMINSEQNQIINLKYYIMAKKDFSALENITPPSIQSELFNYLKPEQQKSIKPFLGVLKKYAQEELCCILLDYMETGAFCYGNNVVLGGMADFLIVNKIINRL